MSTLIDGDLCPLILTAIDFNPSNYIHYNVWDEITDSFLNFKGVSVEVWEWISNCQMDWCYYEGYEAT